MRILFISAFAPTKSTAGQNFTRQLIEDLSKTHEIDLIYWSSKPIKAEVPSNVKILKTYPTPQLGVTTIRNIKYFPLFSRRFDKSILEYIKSICQHYDCLYFDFSQVMLYSIFIDHPYKIGMSHDVIVQKYSRHEYAKYLRKWITNTEKKCLCSLKRIFTFSNKDAKYIQDLYNISTNVVSFYISPEIQKIDLSEIKVEDYFVLYGAWSRPENQYTLYWLIANPIHKKVKIIGGGIPEELKVKIEVNPNNECLGFVENPYPIIAGSKGLIAPLQTGAGVKVKAIESLSLGTPVIGTDVTFEGIELPPSLRKRAFYDIDSLSLSVIYQSLDNISTQDKVAIRNEFLSNYGNKKVPYFLQNNN